MERQFRENRMWGAVWVRAQVPLSVGECREWVGGTTLGRDGYIWELVCAVKLIVMAGQEVKEK